jgi:hypothetical protein
MPENSPKLNANLVFLRGLLKCFFLFFRNDDTNSKISKLRLIPAVIIILVSKYYKNTFNISTILVTYYVFYVLYFMIIMQKEVNIIDITTACWAFQGFVSAVSSLTKIGFLILIYSALSFDGNLALFNLYLTRIRGHNLSTPFSHIFG